MLGPTIYEQVVCGGAVAWDTALQARRSRVQFPINSLSFFIDLILAASLWPWGRLSLLHKWVLGIYPGGKGSWCVGQTTLPASCADCLEILEASTSWRPRGLSMPVYGKLYLYKEGTGRRGKYPNYALNCLLFIKCVQYRITGDGVDEICRTHESGKK